MGRSERRSLKLLPIVGSGEIHSLVREYMKNTIAKAPEIPTAKRNALKYFNLVITPFNKTVSTGSSKRVQNFSFPVDKCFGTSYKIK